MFQMFDEFHPHFLSMENDLVEIIIQMIANQIITMEFFTKFIYQIQ